MPSAGLQAGVYAPTDQIADRWRREARFAPAMEEETRARLTQGWNRAVKAAIGY